MQNANINFESVSEDFLRYAGEWIAVIDGRVVEHEQSFKELYRKIKQKYPKERPLIGKVPEESLLSLSAY